MKEKRKIVLEQLESFPRSSMATSSMLWQAAAASLKNKIGGWSGCGVGATDIGYSYTALGLGGKETLIDSLSANDSFFFVLLTRSQEWIQHFFFLFLFVKILELKSELQFPLPLDHLLDPLCPLLECS
jgi:hypothetical protein